MLLRMVRICTGEVCVLSTRFTPSGEAVASGRIADTPRKFDRDRGEGVDSGETLWLGFSLWGRKAEALADAARKGDLVVLTGTLTQRTFADKHGQDRTVVEVKASEVRILMLPEEDPADVAVWMLMLPDVAVPVPWPVALDCPRRRGGWFLQRRSNRSTGRSSVPMA